ncbi:MAG: 3-oxoadipate--succinyl-CoA transferase [Anaerolineae bacterium SM23_ 63]|nr:MAG: 3-oxoadipate--succinyl-CoA transferase [Anaerolineae bacterium SM23_ 63]HEY47376.1 CoA-transferase subunit beta [Anaerolineae bacterium]
MTNYTRNEMMIVTASRALAGTRTVFVGVGLPNIACNLARRTVAPDLELIYESGVYGARPARLPLSIGDPTLVSDALSVCSMQDLFGLYLQGGRVQVAFLGGAQIDRYGNLNTTMIAGNEGSLEENYTRPKVRLPGSGGACEIAIHAQKVFIIMRLSKRGFVDRLDFLTGPGHLHGGDARDTSGLPGTGPQLVVTDKCVFVFDHENKEMLISSLHPDVELSEVQQEVGWQIQTASDLKETVAPTDEEIHLLREELDPQGMYIG